MDKLNAQIRKWRNTSTSIWDARQHSWAEFVINWQTHSSIYVPIQINLQIPPLSNIPVRQCVVFQLWMIMYGSSAKLEKTGAALHLGRKQQKEGNKHRKQQAPQSKARDFVWLSARDINLQLSSKKLGDWQLGPYCILEKVSPLDYCLDLPLSLNQIHSVFHVTISQA